MAHLVAFRHDTIIPGEYFIFGAFPTAAEADAYRAGTLALLRKNGMGYIPPDDRIEVVQTAEDLAQHKAGLDYFVSRWSRDTSQWADGPFDFEPDGNGGMQKYDWGERQGLR